MSNFNWYLMSWEKEGGGSGHEEEKGRRRWVFLVNY